MKSDGTPPGSDELRRLYALGQRDVDGPSDDELIALIEGRVSAEEREQLVDRLTDSPDAAARYRVLQDVHAHAQPQVERRSLTRYWPAAAAVVVALTASLLLLPPPVEETRVRGFVTEAAPAGLVELTAAPAELTWPTGSVSPPYQLELYDENAALLWSESTSATGRLTLDASAQDVMSAGTYFWTVTDSRGQELGPYWFRVLP